MQTCGGGGCHSNIYGSAFCRPVSVALSVALSAKVLMRTRRNETGTERKSAQGKWSVKPCVRCVVKGQETANRQVTPKSASIALVSNNYVQ